MSHCPHPPVLVWECWCQTCQCWRTWLSTGPSHPSGLCDVGGAWGAPHACAVPAGVPEADQLELFSILAAILHLGNVVVRGRDRRGDGCFVEVGESLPPEPCVPDRSLSRTGCGNHVSAIPR